MGLFGFLFIMVSAIATGILSGSLLLGFVVWLLLVFILPGPTPAKARGGSLLTTLLCLVGLYWLFGGDSEE